jgi:hypothetical protein
MPADVHRARYTRPKYGDWTYDWLMKTLQNTLAMETSDVAKYRLHIIQYYYKYGLKPTLDAFRIKKSTFYDWKTAYGRGQRIINLVPKSTTPHQCRKMQVDWRLIEFIKGMRKEYGNVSNNIIKPFLDAYAVQVGIKTIGLTTIGKVIKRRGLTFESRVKLKPKNKFKKLRVRKSPKVTCPGFIQMDSIVVYINQERYFFMSVMDIYTKYALVKYVETLSSNTAKSVFMEFQTINPTRITIVQTDNGSEFLASFHNYLDEAGIKHQFIYPRMCKINGFIERFNRTVQEEFILRNDEIYYDVGEFKQKLVQYLHWYNFKRPHSSLKYLSPMDFIQTKIPKSP